MATIKRWSGAVWVLSLAVFFAGCTHVQLNRSDLTPSDVKSFNSAAKGKPYTFRKKNGSISRGLNGLAIRSLPQEGWVLTSFGTEAAGPDSRNVNMKNVETIRILEGSKKYHDRGFWEGAGLGTAVAAPIGFALLFASPAESGMFANSRLEFGLAGAAVFGAGGFFIGGMIGGGNGSTTKTERAYFPKGF